MRYDDFDDYSSRSSRGGSRGSSRSGDRRDYGSRGYSDRSYSDRGYSDRSYSGRGYSDRSFGGYGRDSYEDFERYSSRDYDRRPSDRYGSDRYSGSRDRYDDFDRRSWERTAPKLDNRGGRSHSGSSRDPRSSGSYGGERRSSGGSRSGSGSRSSSGARGGSGSRSSGSRRGSSSRSRPAPKSQIPLLPIAVIVVVIIVAALVISSLLGGGDSDYKIKFGSETIVPGETTTATIDGLKASEDYEIQWFSSDPSVVSLESSGESCTLTAESVGTANIGATINGEVNISGTIIVAETAPGVVKVNLNQETLEIFAGETYTMQATVIMESNDMTPAKVSWSSNDPSVARVDSNGVITAREVGMAIIKASAGEQTAEVAVTVVENPNNPQHDESTSTGTEPEEGAELPDDDAGTDGDTASGENQTGGTSGNDTSGDNGAGSGDAGGETTEDGGGDTGGDTDEDLGSDITGQTPAEETT